MVSTDDVFEFSNRFSSLYRSKQALMAAEITAVYKRAEAWYNAAGMRWASRFDEETEKAYKESQGCLVAWRQVASIVLNWSITLPKEITDEVWTLALGILERYEKGRIVNHQLITREQP